MNYQLFYYFHVLANHLNFTIAANKLGIKQPTLSQQIKKLEEQLDVQLFHRNNRKVTLTISGQYLFEQTKSIQSIFNDTFENLKNLEIDDNTLRVGALHGELSELLSDVFVKFHKEFPSIHIKFLSIDNIQEHIDKGKIDIGFTYNGVSDSHQSEFIIQEKFYLISPEKYNVTDHVELDDLNNYPVILMTEDYLCRQLVEEEMKKHKKRIIPTLEVSSLDILYKMVRNELGISIVSGTSLSLVDLEGINISNINNLTITREVYMYHNSQFRKNAIAQSFYKMTMDEFKKLRIITE
ncbi:LysR family transcriptional regulator [Paenibacillus sp. Marseille-Q7038]